MKDPKSMMASSISSLACTSVILLVLVFALPSTARSDVVTPLTTPSPSFDNLCELVNCGRGTCSVDRARPFNFVCQCDPGWRRTPINNEDGLQFLPCVIPNCTINYSCLPAPRPLSPQIPDNISFFHPCYWTYCGEGTCNRNLTTYYTYTCNCNPGYTNLFSISYLPCFSSCAIGADCNRLGMWSTNVTSPSGDNNRGGTAGSATSQGIRFLPGRINGIGIIVMSAAMAL